MNILSALHITHEAAGPLQGLANPLTMLLVVIVILAFVAVYVMNHIIKRRVSNTSKRTLQLTTIMQHALNISGNNVVRYDLRTDHIEKIHGHMLPEEGISYREYLNHIHPEDRHDFENFIENLSGGVVKSDECSYRWNFDYSGGKPRWGYLRNMSIAEYADGFAKPVSIISTLTDETEAMRQQQEENDVTARYRLLFEESIIGLSFYDRDGRLMTANRRMREILNFRDGHDPYYFNSCLFAQEPFRDIMNPRKVEELYFCTKLILPEREVNIYSEIRLQPSFNQQGELSYISVSVRDITEERNLYLQSRLNDQQIRHINEEIRHYEDELQYLMENCDMRVWRSSFESDEIQFFKGLRNYELKMTFGQFADHLADDPDGTIASHFAHPEEAFQQTMASILKMHDLFDADGPDQWYQVNSVPITDESGKVTGGFGLIRNITSLMEKQEQLRRETERANDSGRQKSIFLANMTHEIRTPLNAIVGFSDLLQSIEGSDDKREMIRIIHNNCDMLLRLINDILAISNMDSDAAQLTPEDVDFATAFDDICQSLAQRVQEPAVEFQKDNPYRSLKTRIDNGRIQQVITNFVTNAVKYTHQGHIRVGYRIREKGLYVYCEDTGAGIPKDQCSRVFERFVKLNDYIQGTGLGLSICKTIVERCGGNIGVDSELGKGSTFWFWIPCDITEVTDK